MKKVVAATNNAKKLEEMNRILTQLGWEVVGLRSCGDFPEPVEDADSFEGNARIKALAAHRNTGLAAIADDSGLCVKALSGAPGVYSARYGGPGLDDAGRNTLLLENLRGQLDRSATFVSVVTCCFPNGDVVSARGECAGAIAYAPMGENDFGYDPVFLVKGMRKTYAQMTAEEKNGISHRGRAMEQFKVELEKYLNGTDK